MKLFFTALLCLGVLQERGDPVGQVAAPRHRPIEASSVIRIPRGLHGSQINELVGIGLENHIPIGIVLPADMTAEVCNPAHSSLEGSENVGELISKLRAANPHYKIELSGGVLNVEPADLPDPARRLLKMKIERFQAPSETHMDMGYDLWKWIYAELAPKTGSNTSHLRSTTAEKIPAMSLGDETVESILNKIVNEGDAGIWVLHTSQLKELSSQSHMPYQVRGYIGGTDLLSAADACVQ